MRDLKIHLTYLSIILVLAIFGLLGFLGFFTTAEKTLFPAEKTFFSNQAAGASYVKYEGSWREDGQPTDKSSRSTVECNSADMQCRETTIKVTGNVMLVQTFSFALQEWTNDRIISRAATECRKYVTIIEPGTQQVTKVTSDIPNRSDQACHNLRPLAAPKLVRLVDGRSL